MKKDINYRTSDLQQTVAFLFLSNSLSIQPGLVGRFVPSGAENNIECDLHFDTTHHAFSSHRSALLLHHNRVSKGRFQSPTVFLPPPHIFHRTVIATVVIPPQQLLGT